MLETPRLHVIPVTADDLDLFWELDRDPEVMRFVDTGRPPTRERMASEILPRLIQVGEGHPGLGWFTARDRATGAKLGWFHFRPSREEPRDVDLGYRFLRAHWGRGLATEGSRALVEHGFLTLAVPRVVAHALVANRASTRVMEKVGLRPEREFIEPAVVHPDKRAIRYGVAREDWLLQLSQRST